MTAKRFPAKLSWTIPFVLAAACSSAADAPSDPATGRPIATTLPSTPKPDGGAGRGSAAPCGDAGGPVVGAPIDVPPVGAPPEQEPPPPPIPAGPMVTPDTFADGEVNVTSEVHSDRDRHTISPLVYGMNYADAPALPPEVLRGTSFVRRGGDRSNTVNWETNGSNGAELMGWQNDMYLARTLPDPNAPGGLDRRMIADDIAGGRGSMVPFVLNGYVAGPPASNIPYSSPGWDIGKYFRRVELRKNAPFAATPDLDDGVVYTDEHIDFLRRTLGQDIYAPGPTQVMIGSDNEPDLWESNYPMLQRGHGEDLFSSSGAKIGNRLTADEFIARFLDFAKRVKEIAPNSMLVGPDHFHFDGYTNWHTPSDSRYTDDGRWFIDDFLAAVRAASDSSGVPLLDTWDMHWYPQPKFNGTFTWKLDNDNHPLTSDEIDAIIQGPRSYWDPDYYEHSWITDDHLHAPAQILVRLFSRIEEAYPGMPLGVTEYFPGGCGHVSSAIGVADTLGIFGRMGVHVAAMWPHTCDLSFAFGGFRLFRNADGAGLGFGATSVQVVHPEKAESSLYAATTDNGVTVVAINKTNAPRKFGIRLFHPALTNVAVYRVDSGNKTPLAVGNTALTHTNAHVYEAPPMSVSLLVFE